MCFPQGTLFDTGAEFDAGTVDFVIGEGEVITGLEQGVTGMQLGEKR